MVMGVRCSNSDYTYAILEGTQLAPRVVIHAHVRCPAGFSRPQCLHWLQLEFTDLFARHQPRVVAIKGAEGLASRGKPFVERTEMEAVVMVVSAGKGIRHVPRKVKATIAKDLGVKGKGRYLASLDTSSFPDFSSMDEKLRDAILVAWSMLP